MKPSKNLEHPIHELINTRWSPRAFAAKAIPEGVVQQMFEGARWAASSRNVQPWRFIVAHAAQTQDFDALIDCMLPGNSAWCRHAALVGLACARHNFEHADVANPHAVYDLGQAMAFLSLQANALDISMHQIAGFDAEKARQVVAVPADYAAVCMFVAGYRGAAEQLPEDLHKRELSAQTRKPLATILGHGSWAGLAPDDGGTPLY